MRIYRYIVFTFLLAGPLAKHLPAAFSGFREADTSFALPESLNERIEVLTDRYIYAVGERILFSGFLVSPPALDTACWSRVLYLELLTPGGNSVARGKFPVSCSRASGYLPIPESLLTGNYYLVAYTKWMRNFSPVGYHYQLLKVINPFTSQLEPSNLSNGERQPADRDQKALDQVIVCSTGKALYRQREKVGLTISLPGFQGSISGTYTVSVVRKGAVDSIGERHIRPQTVIYHPRRKNIYLPETRGLSLSGEIVLKDSAPSFPGGLVNLAILGQNPEFRVARHGQEGSFCFALDSMYGKNDMYITADHIDETIDIRIDNDFANPAVRFPEVPFILSEREKKLAGEILFNSQVNKQFPTPEKGRDSPADEKDKRPAFYGRPSHSILIDDYIDLPTLKEVLIELVPGVFPRVRNKEPFLTFSGNKMTLTLINQYAPLLLVDHVPIQDLEKLLLMSPKKIHSVEVLNEIYIIGNTTYGGILNILTRQGDLGGIDLPENSFFFDFTSYLPQEKIIFPQYENPAFDRENPDYRNCLYWSPALMALPGRAVELDFYTSDNSGDYLVVVRGVAEDGTILQGKCEFRVE